MSKEEPKVTECWTQKSIDGYPSKDIAFDEAELPEDRPAVLMWREDYDAMRKELEELRVRDIAHKGSAQFKKQLDYLKEKGD